MTAWLAAGGRTQVYVLGVSHVSRESVDAVRELIQEVRPEVVLLELCKDRLRLLLDPVRTCLALSSPLTCLCCPPYASQITSLMMPAHLLCLRHQCSTAQVPGINLSWPLQFCTGCSQMGLPYDVTVMST